MIPLIHFIYSSVISTITVEDRFGKLAGKTLLSFKLKPLNNFMLKPTYGIGTELDGFGKIRIMAF